MTGINVGYTRGMGYGIPVPIITITIHNITITLLLLITITIALSQHRVSIKPNNKLLRYNIILMIVFELSCSGFYFDVDIFVIDKIWLLHLIFCNCLLKITWQIQIIFITFGYMLYFRIPRTYLIWSVWRARRAQDAVISCRRRLIGQASANGSYNLAI